MDETIISIPYQIGTAVVVTGLAMVLLSLLMVVPRWFPGLPHMLASIGGGMIVPGSVFLALLVIAGAVRGERGTEAQEDA